MTMQQVWVLPLPEACCCMAQNSIFTSAEALEVVLHCSTEWVMKLAASVA